MKDLRIESQIMKTLNLKCFLCNLVGRLVHSSKLINQAQKKIVGLYKSVLGVMHSPAEIHRIPPQFRHRRI